MLYKGKYITQLTFDNKTKNARGEETYRKSKFLSSHLNGDLGKL